MSQAAKLLFQKFYFNSGTELGKSQFFPVKIFTDTRREKPMFNSIR